MALSVASNSGINNMASGFSRICRTCAACTDCLMPIFSGEGLLNNLADKIHRHLPIQVSERDRLPQQLCQQCASTLLAWHELVKCCAQADAALRVRLQRLQELTHQEYVLPPDPAPVLDKATPLKTEHDVKSQVPAHRCAHCAAQFTQLALYRDHLASVHIDCLFHCQECDQYEERDNLMSHMARHARAYAHASPAPAPAPPSASPRVASKISTRNFNAGLHLESSAVKLEKIVVSDGSLLTPKLEKLDETSIKTALRSGGERNGSKRKRSAEREKADASRLGFSDSDSSDGFGRLPDSVFAAIEDARESPDEPLSKKRAAKNKAWKRSCGVCGKEFTVSSSYFYHAKYVHTDRGKRRHACDSCELRFPSRAALCDHESVHTGVRPHVCAQCPKAFRSKAGLYIHVQDVHSILEKRFTCAECNKSFRWKQKLILHFKRHRRERAHVCAVCSRGFSARCDLTRHMRTHSAHKPHHCAQCGASFAQRRYLQQHASKQHSGATAESRS